MQQSEPSFHKGLTIDSFQLTRYIGSGGTAEVWEVEDVHMNKWAMKIFSPSHSLDDHAIRVFRQQFKIGEKLDHPNILRTKKYGEYNNRPYIIFDLCDTSLMKLLHDRLLASITLKLSESPIYKEEELASIISQVAGALDYLHQRGVIHQDIKPDNILVKSGLNNDDIYVISDFGISTDMKMTILKDPQNSGETNKGLTPDYASPELYQGVVLKSTDIFALGISLYELCTGKPPIANSAMTTAIALLNNNGFIPDLPDCYSKRFNDLVKSCLKLDPDDRPTAEQLRKWADFYLSEYYWPEEVSIIRSQKKPGNWSKYLKYAAIAIIVFLLLMVSGFFVLPKLSNKEHAIAHAVNQLDFDEARNIFEKLDQTRQSELAQYSYVVNAQLSRVDRVRDINYAIVRDRQTYLLGILNEKGLLTVPMEYDQILKIIDPEVITVKTGNKCRQIDIQNKDLNNTGNCRIYYSMDEFENVGQNN